MNDYNLLTGLFLRSPCFVGRPKELTPSVLFTDDPFWEIGTEDPPKAMSFASVLSVCTMEGLRDARRDGPSP